MKESHRQSILDSCSKSKESKIVITHGTDTMTKTAKVLAEKNLNKTIILTGAMIPYKFGTSDGLFNLGGAIAYAQSLPKGVYIAMNGQVFEWNKVEKNQSKGIFIRVK